MSEPSRAVFLSYASQDAEAAKRICEALRQAGVEVWFDAEGGLEHGDEWDAKIRRQIKECVLFIPVISANTEAREEGYFRIEWDLAAERARGIASGVAFILPVVIDGTREQDALVPDRFRAVQWTKLPGGSVPPEILRRFLKLWSHRTGALKHEADRKNVEPARPRSEEDSRSTGRFRGLHVGLAVAVFASGAVSLWWLRRGSASSSVQEAGQPVAAVPAPVAVQFPQDANLAKAVQLVETINSTVEDHRLAEDLAKAVLERRPTDAEAVIVNAYVNNRFIQRGFDLSADRYTTARRLSERALALAPDHPEALFVMGMHLVFRQADSVRAVELMRRAIELQPNRARYYNSYIEALETADPPEAVRQAEAAVARFPADAILRYRLALVHAWVTGNVEAYERAIDETLAIAPVATAVIRKAVLQLLIHHDVPAARRTLDAVPGEFRLNDRTVFTRYMIANADGDVAEAIRALATLPGDFIIDFGRTPKRLLVGDLWRRQGNEVLARREYEAALAEIARERATNPDAGFHYPETWLLLRLGRREEARAKTALVYAMATRPHRLRGVTNHGYGSISLLLHLDERAKAIELLREAVATDWTRRMLAGNFAINPDLAPWREDAEIQALLREPASTLPVTGSAPSAALPLADDKSVAVLPFANLSGDPAQEYFSDGLTEEILNTLARERDLRVVPRTSAFSFKGRNLPLAEIARALNVAQIVEGSVQRVGDRLRIRCTVTRVADGFSEAVPPFDREIRDGADLFAAQDQVAAAVLGKLIARNPSVRTEVPTRNLAAFDAYLRGRAAPAVGSHGVRESIGLYEQAVSLDPQFALAWARLAEAQAVVYGWGSADSSEELLARARRSLQQALELEPNLPEALLARARLALVTGDLSALRRDLERVESVQPGLPEASFLRAFLAGVADRDWSAAAVHAREALARDPKNGDWANMLAVNVFVPAADFAGADRLYGQIEHTSPRAFNNRVLLRIQWRGPAAALALLESSAAAARNHETDTLRGLLLWKDGRTAEAHELATRVAEEVARTYRDYFEPRSRLLQLLELTGNREAAGRLAAAELERWEGVRRSGNETAQVIAAIASAHLATGHIEEARRILRTWQPPASERDDVRRMLRVAPAFAQVGETERAIGILQTAAAAGYVHGHWLRFEPGYAGLHGDGRFTKLMEAAEAAANAQLDQAD